MLDGGEVVPGFTCRVTGIFEGLAGTPPANSLDAAHDAVTAIHDATD